MKPTTCLVAAVLAMTVLTSHCGAADDREAKPRFKGVELYSWKDGAGNWVFVLVDGTNRIKSEKEVKAVRNPIKGVEKLTKALALLAVGEHVGWVDLKGFEYPPKATRQIIEKAARKAKLDLGYSPRGE